MDFLSAPFFATQAALLMVYWMVHRTEWRNRVLLAGSLFFLFTLGWHTAMVLVASALIEWRIALKVGAAATPSGRKRWLWASLILNLSQLALFKYGSAFLPSLQEALSDLHFDGTTLSILMPVGLSFWTLQKMTLTLEVYFRKRAPEADPVKALLFTAFFPTVLSGPIEPARNLLPRLAQERRFEARIFSEAVWLFAIGAFLKAVVADNVGAVADRMLDPGQGGVAVVIGGWAYALQLFGDFAGYSYMARGLARLYGLDLTQNFGAPFLARNLSDFWKQWHVSLTNWLNEYVFAAVSMRLRNLGTYGIVLAIWATFLVSGLWHGTGWLFVVYGGLHAFGVTIFTLSKDWRRRLASRYGKDGWLAWAAALLTFHYVCLTFLVFRSHDLPAAWSQLAALFQGEWNPFALPVDWPTLALSAASVLWLQRQAQVKRDVFWIFARPVWYRVGFYMTLGFLITRYFAPAVRFIYFQF